MYRQVYDIFMPNFLMQAEHNKFAPFIFFAELTMVLSYEFEYSIILKSVIYLNIILMSAVQIKQL
jgi:hypothetical protein